MLNVVILNRVVRIGHTTKLTWEQRLEGVEGVGHGDSWGTSIPGREKTCAESLRLGSAWLV